ncbi:MAG TPA: plasmid pRiA4b ORF-3 family protein, partial [Clostridia bacterium]|nr:plasmid pRiA4b ORF-3 family protein [Clostridia bacterium]
DDTLGYKASRHPVNYSRNHDDGFIPAEAMVKALVELTGKPAYKYRAFELLATLDLDIYKATRRMIVPADMGFSKLHELMQEVFDWNNCHLHDFTVVDSKDGKPVARLVMSEEDLAYDKEAVLESTRKLSDYLPKYKHIIYTYDMGDNWEHTIEFIREIEEHYEESPFLLEAEGQTPPEDVGGVSGFIEFREIMLDQSHPEHASTKEWVGCWSKELREWETKPKVIQC